MLILPMERTFDIRRPPVVTFLLLLINVIVFFATVGGDEGAIDAAIAEYEDRQLLDIELPIFKEYLAAVPDAPEEWQRLENAGALDEEERYFLVYWMLMDPDYSDYIDRNADRFTIRELDALEEKEEIVETYQETMPVFRYGFIPADFSVLTMLTSQFMHGGLGHLVGNMVILVLIGLTVEQLLGSFNFLLFYLISGAVGCILFGIIHLGSPLPLVGASGAISGVMGMYVAAYGRRPIRFFYWIGFYFNYIKLPALVMLPVWLGKEVFDFFFTDTNVAYTAHAGGLVAGAALVLVGKNSFAKIDVEVMENRDMDAEYREDLARALHLVDNANFVPARDMLVRLLKRYPDDHRVLFQIVQLLKAHPASKDYHVATYKYLKSVLTTGTVSKDALTVIEDYWECATPKPRIQGTLLQQLINKLIVVDELELAEEICESAEEHGLLDAEALEQANSYRLKRQRSGA